MSLLRKFLPAGTIFFILFALSFYYAWTSEGVYDAGDGIQHYLISRYSFRHPELFLHHWGKPFFTLVSFPFSQFGFLGINVFNILCGLAAAWVTYRIAQQLGYTYPYVSIFFVYFTPLYFVIMISGLTEIFFSLVLVSSVFLIIRNKFTVAFLIISFLPMIRSEGLFLFPLYITIGLYRRKYFSLLFLATGTLLYSIAGYFYFGDFFWLQTQNPYKGAGALYGSGELLHFIKNNEFILGTPLVVLFIAGILFLFYHGVRLLMKREKRDLFPEEILLVFGISFTYLAVHSVLRWKGLGSLGLIRVMAGVAPLTALIAGRGIDLLFSFLRNRKIIQYALLGIILILVIRVPFKQYHLPFSLAGEEKVIKEAGDWFRQSEYKDRKIFYLYPFLSFTLDIDPFNRSKVADLWGIPSVNPEAAVAEKDIVIWDAHFGPNECRLPLDSLANNKYFRVIKTFRPEKEFKVLGGYPFEVYIFERIP